MEDSRNFSDPNEIDEYLARLVEMLEVGQIPAAFLINADETGFQEFVDARGSARIVPTEYPLNSVSSNHVIWVYLRFRNVGRQTFKSMKI